MREFTEEQVMFRQAYRKFLEAEIEPNMAAWKKAGIVDRKAFEKAGEQGFLMIWPEEKYGGLGDDDFRYEQIIIEELAAKSCFDWYSVLHSRLVGPYFKNLGTEEQRERFLPPAVRGEKILAVAMTEPDAGSDLAGMRSSVKQVGDHFVLNGSKTYISNGINGDVIIVAARQEGIDASHALTLCIVERGMEGFERGRNLEKMGLKAQDTAELFFNNVHIPKENILGEPGQGFKYLMQGLAEERLIGAVGYIGAAKAAFDETRKFCLERKMFGSRLADMQNTQFQMADMDAEIELCQVYVDYCVAQHNKGRLTANMGAKAKLMTSEVQCKMVDLGVQLHGGAGYMMEYPIATMYLDARISRIYAGASEVMKLIIGRDVFSDSYRNVWDD